MEVLLEVGCLPYAVGKQPSMPSIVEENGRLVDDNDITHNKLDRCIFPASVGQILWILKDRILSLQFDHLKHNKRSP